MGENYYFNFLNNGKYYKNKIFIFKCENILV